MSIGAKVRSEKDQYGPSYELVSLLGTGALGGVFLGENRDGEEIAVKIPHLNLTPESLDRFWQELPILNELGKASGGRFYPKAWRGVDDSGRAVLCMEKAQGERLVDMAAVNMEAVGHLHEGIALPTGIEYLKMIEILHRTRISCPDRKPNDLYWKTPENNLTVLDWNVVDVGEEFERNKNQDLYIFGAMWYELLTGSLPPPLTERIQHPLGKHPYWPKISYGLRHILSKLLATDPKQRYVEPESAQQDLERHWSDFRSPAETLAERADQKLKEAHLQLDEGMRTLAKANADTRYDPEMAEQRLKSSTQAIASLSYLSYEAQRLADLAQRKGALNGERLFNRAEELRKSLNRLIADAAQQVMLVQYSAALNYLQVAEKAVEDDPVAMLNLNRWRLLAEAGRLAIEESNLSLSKHLDELKYVISSLETAQWQAAEDGWHRAKDGLTRAGWSEETTAGKYIFSLGREIIFWQQWDDVRQAEGSHQFGKAAQAYREASDAVQQVPEDYATRILAVVALSREGLASKATEMTYRHKTEGRVIDTLKECRSWLEDGDYSAALQESSKGLELVSGFGSLSEQRKRLQHYRDMARWLIKLENAREGLGWINVLDIMGEMAEKSAPEEDDSFAWIEIQVAMESVLSFLQLGFGDGTGNEWRNVKTADVAQESYTLLSAVKDLNERYPQWLQKSLKPSSPFGVRDEGMVIL